MGQGVRLVEAGRRKRRKRMYVRGKCEQVICLVASAAAARANNERVCWLCMPYASTTAGPGLRLTLDAALFLFERLWMTTCNRW